MTAARILLGAILLCCTTATYAKVRSPSANDKLQAACFPDVQRLCNDALPDEGKVRACMESKKAMISAKCLQAYKESQQ